MRKISTDDKVYYILSFSEQLQKAESTTKEVKQQILELRGKSLYPQNYVCGVYSSQLVCMSVCLSSIWVFKTQDNRGKL